MPARFDLLQNSAAFGEVALAHFPRFLFQGTIVTLGQRFQRLHDLEDDLMHGNTPSRSMNPTADRVYVARVRPEAGYLDCTVVPDSTAPSPGVAAMS